MKRMQKVGLAVVLSAMVLGGCSSSSNSSGGSTGTDGSTSTDGVDGLASLTDVVGGDTQGTDGADGADGASALDGADGTSGAEGNSADVIIAAPDTAAPDELSCTGILQCVNTECSNITDPATQGACLTDCQSQGSAQSSLAFQNFFQCIGQNCTSVGQDEYPACVEANCNNEYLACVIGEGGTLDCGGLLGCLNGCTTAADPAACQSECVGQVESAEVLNTYTAIEECVFAACPAPEGGTPDQSCVAAAQQTGGECADELEACIIGEGGTLDCGGIFNCINSCATVECAQECQGQAQDGAALSEFQAIASCIATECPDQSEACAGAALAPGGACAAEVEACFGGVDPTDGGDGTESMEGADGPSDGNDGSSIPSFALPMKTPAIPAADFKSRLPKMPRM